MFDSPAAPRFGYDGNSNAMIDIVSPALPDGTPPIDDDARWQRVLMRDRASDGLFVTCVRTTGIYCRPSCAARHPGRANVEFRPTPAEAEAAGFRACLRCRPDAVARDEAAVAEAIALIGAAEKPPTLDRLAATTGYSPAHFQRVFKRAVGLSPAAYARAMRRTRAGEALTREDSVAQAIYAAGFSAPSRFYAAHEGRLGMAPSAWVAGGAGAEIHWAMIGTSLGRMLVAATAKGVCRLSFDEDEAALRRRFPHATLIEGSAKFADLFDRVVAAVETPGDGRAIPLDVRGTAFQEAVWQALQRIPPGETRSYADIAAAIGRPKAVRAAGSANGANNVAILIPCHRVIRGDGTLGGYAYGLDRKRILLDRERDGVSDQRGGDQRAAGSLGGAQE